MERTGNVPKGINTDVAGYTSFFGAACEITTAKALRGINDCFVINDIAITKPDGNVTANIDHLACFPEEGNFVAVDSKFWSQPPEFYTRKGATTLHPEGPHNRAVATCLYEDSFLPHPPLALVFAVRGSAAESLHDPVSVDYYPAYDYEGNMDMKYVPFPVVFVDHRQLQDAVSKLGVGMYYADVLPKKYTWDVDVLELAGKSRVGDYVLEPTTKLRF